MMRCSNNEADQGVWLDTVTVCTSLATLKRAGDTAFCGLKLIIILTCYTFYFTTFELKKTFSTCLSCIQIFRDHSVSVRELSQKNEC